MAGADAGDQGSCCLNMRRCSRTKCGEGDNFGVEFDDDTDSISFFDLVSNADCRRGLISSCTSDGVGGGRRR